ncbi:MAG: hypothetical protein LBO78_02065 [Rickettsiales bacterium]|jgi:hypothetical protein|nr:hypothetical protein [Rickettsiales bacterium]
MSLKPGALVFQVLGKGGFVDAISISASREDARLAAAPVSHVGIIAGFEEVVHVDEKDGVIIAPLGEFLAGAGLSVVAEVRDADVASRAAAAAYGYVGRPYNASFYPGGEGLYCSELVAKCFICQSGMPYFAPCRMNFRDAGGRLIPYWIEYYAKLGCAIPEGMEGSHPQQLLAQKHLFSSIRPIRRACPPVHGKTR